MKDKVILTDVDGVLLDWDYAFNQWMKRHEYERNDFSDYKIEKSYNLQTKEAKRLVRMFNESAWIRRLPPLWDSIKYVKKLHNEYGYIFHAITSLSNDEYAQHLRTKNLREMFGDTVFEKYVYLDTGADKTQALSEYRDTKCWWIEDKCENADLGLELGLKSILVNHYYNTEYTGYACIAYKWKDIYTLITGDHNG